MSNPLGAVSLGVLASLYLYFIACAAPSLEHEDMPLLPESQKLRIPRSLEDITSLVVLLSLYKQHCLHYVLLLFCSAYLYTQSFAIPGSVFMNLLSGALFGVTFGFPLVCLLTGLGATGCYLLSKYFGKRYIQWLFPKKVIYLQNKVEDNMDSLFYFLLFLRILPMSPNWFINLASPIANIPIKSFFFSALLGLMPYNFICVQAGSILSQLNSVNDMFTWNVLLQLFLLALVALVPAIITRKLRNDGKTKRRNLQNLSMNV